MKAIILAAGYATRLYPLTKDIPKQLLNVGEKKMIEHIIHKIEGIEDIDAIYVITNNKFYRMFLKWQEHFKSKKNIIIINDNTNSNEDRLGAIGDMHFAISTLKIDDDVLVVGGDNLFEFDLNNLVRMFKKKKATVIAARDLGEKEKLAKKFGVVEIDENMKIIGFEEKPELPKTSLCATCIYLFIRNDIKELEECIKKNKKPDNSGDFIRHLAETRHVYCYVFNEKWYDIGSHEEYKEVQKIYSTN